MSAPSPSGYADPAAGRYPSDVDDATWALIAPLVAPARARGRPRVHTDRVINNANLYVLRGGIQWRMVPSTFPLWQTVYSRFRRWADAGVWEALTDTLRVELRIELGRAPTPSAAIIASPTDHLTPAIPAVTVTSAPAIADTVTPKAPTSTASPVA